ncbi:E3 ubiquitin-protein ligase E3D-like [Argonauta hians]
MINGARSSASFAAMSTSFDAKQNISGYQPKKTWSMLYAERLKNLGRFTLYLNVDRIQNETGYSNIRVQVDSGSVSITTGQGRGREWTWKLDIPEVQFHPASCRGLRCSRQGELQCTLQTSLPNLLMTPNLSRSSESQLSSHLVTSLSKGTDSCRCRSCGNVIVPVERKFRRVLPLPSEAWIEMSGNHFCHQHETPGSSKKPKPSSNPGSILTPKSGDCLVSDLYFLANSTDLSPTALTRNMDTFQVMCRRCRTELGTCLPTSGDASEEYNPDKFVCKIYSYAINMTNIISSVSEPLIGVNRWTFTEESYLISYLLEQSRIHTSFKFIVESSQSNNQPAITCLVWLLDTIQVYELNDIPTAAEHKHVHELTLEPEVRQKILYQAAISDVPKSSSQDRKIADEVLKLWKLDLSVHLLTLSPYLTATLLRYLISSTNSLPSSCRRINEFHAGFLRPP